MYYGRYHGESSQGLPKKAVGIKIYNDTTLKHHHKTGLGGLPKSHKWVLKAPYADRSLVRLNVFVSSDDLKAQDSLCPALAGVCMPAGLPSSACAQVHPCMVCT